MASAMQDPDALYEKYRVHQKDLFRECLEDARLMLKRVRLPDDTPEGGALVELATALFTTRCAPWTAYRIEHGGFVAASEL